MKLKIMFRKITSLLLVTIILLSAIPVTVFASPADIFDGVETAPINKNATQTAKNFYQYLWNVRKSDSVIVGATSSKLYGLDTEAINAENDYYLVLKEHFGVTPAIFAPFKAISYQIEHNYLPTIVERYKQGSVPLFHLHGVMTADSLIESYEDPRDLIVNYDKTNPNRDMTLYNEWVEELKMVGDYFEQVEKAGIEVYLFKMFSEMNNTNKKGLFGASTEGYKAFHNVWKQAVEYLTVERGLKGILFAYCPAGFTTSEPLYPGDDYVDIIAPTSYSNYATGAIYAATGCEDYPWMKDRPKPFGFSELGPRGLDGASPIGDCKELLESIVYAYPETSFAVLWYENRLSLLPPGDYTTNGNYNGDYFMYHDQVIVAEEMVDYKSSTPLKSTGFATLYSKINLKNSVSNLGLGDFNAKKLKELSIDLTKIKSLNVLHGCAVAVYQTDDCTGKAKLYYGAKKDLADAFENAKSISIIKLDNVAFEKDIWVDNYSQSAFSLNDGENAEWVFEKNDEDSSVSITMNLGRQYNIGQMSINHAGFYDNFKYNIRDFAVYTSTDGIDYTKVYEKYGNVLPASNFYFNSTDAQYVRFEIIVPNSSTSAIEKNLISFAEIEVYGTDKVEALVDETVNSGVVQIPSDNVGVDIDDTVVDMDITTEEPETQDYGKEELIVPEDEEPEIPAIVIPEFYNYVWIIICGGIVLISAATCGIILLASKKRVKIK